MISNQLFEFTAERSMHFTKLLERLRKVKIKCLRTFVSKWKVLNKCFLVNDPIITNSVHIKLSRTRTQSHWHQDSDHNGNQKITVYFNIKIKISP